jgi:hypothetical protein
LQDQPATTACNTIGLYPQGILPVRIHSLLAHDATLTSQGYPEAEARELVDSECGSVLRERRAAALEVITQARKFLEWQVGVAYG